MSKNTRERHRRKVEYFETLKDTAKAVDPYVRKFIQNMFQTNPELSDLLFLRYRFGKPQLRPTQVRFAYELVGGEDWKKSIPACAAVEAKDTGYYCFDEVLDSGANPNLILLGGVFSSISYAMINDLFLTYSPMQVQQVLQEISSLDINNAQAAIIDLNLETPNRELYMQKARGYNFWEQALKIGGILGGASEIDISRLGQAGQKIGMAHIIANDTWDFGKSLEDFRAGKYTLPIIWAFENTTSEDKQTLESLLGREDITEEQTNIVRGIMVRSGSIEYGKSKAKELCDEGIKLLSYFPNTHSIKMLEFATTWTQRNRYYKCLEQFK